MKLFNKKPIKYPLVLLLVTALVFGMVYMVFFGAKKAEAAWFDDTWSYRQVISVIPQLTIS